MSSTITQEKNEATTKEVQIWSCMAEDCNAWIKDEFVTEASPSCPLCKSPMERGVREIPAVVKKVNKTFIMGRRRF